MPSQGRLSGNNMATETGDNENEKRKDQEVWKYLPTLLLSISCIGFGLYLTINNLVIVGMSSRTLQPTAKGGELFILVGLIFLVVTYYSISPFSRLRQFIEGKTGINKRKK